MAARISMKRHSYDIYDSNVMKDSLSKLEADFQAMNQDRERSAGELHEVDGRLVPSKGPDRFKTLTYNLLSAIAISA